MRDAATGAELSGIEVQLLADDGGGWVPVATQRTASPYRFRVPPGTYRLCVDGSDQGYGSACYDGVAHDVAAAGATDIVVGLGDRYEADVDIDALSGEAAPPPGAGTGEAAPSARAVGAGPRATGTLARTGASPWLLAGLATALLGAGVSLTRLGRRVGA